MGLFKEDLKITPPMGRHFDPVDTSYDAIIIGAGMSGMAAAIRLGMYDKKVLLLERHSISGGLNSYYNRRKRGLDVGLHALTNFAEKGERRKPLTKLLKQLRIPYDKLELTSQFESQVSFPEVTLRFNNDIELFQSEIATQFPDQVENFLRLLEHILNFNEVALDNKLVMAKDVVDSFISNHLLREMIFCPLLIYGSAWENDMDFSQFVIMFKSIYLEGFGRSRGGVRRVLELLRERIEEVGAEVCYRNGVKEILTHGNQSVGVITDRGQEVMAPLILSCAGYPETLSLINDQNDTKRVKPRTGKLSFTETIFTLPEKPASLGLNQTIIFHNDAQTYSYQRPQELYDKRSAVICLPNNFIDDDYQEGVYRLTMMANYELWKKLSQDKVAYNEKKAEVLQDSLMILKKYMPALKSEEISFQDIFTPTTVEHYTGHFGGCVYGSPDKSRDGTTPFKGLFLCGTDQGFLGIVGSMLSGISMANLHGFMNPSLTTDSSTNITTSSL